MPDERRSAFVRWKIDSLTELQIACDEVNIRHAAPAPFDVHPRAAGFLCLNALAHGCQLFFQIRSVRRRLKARFAHSPSGTRTEGRVARHFTRFQISRMLP